MLFALKGVSNRAFYRWIANNFKHLFPRLPHRTRLIRLFDGHRHLIDVFMAEPSLIGVIDTYGIELIHPRREGRSKRQIGRKGISNQRWIVGGKLCLLHNHLGLIVSGDFDTANVYLALGNIALVFAVLTSRDSEIGGFSIARDLLSHSLSTHLILSSNTRH